MSSLWGKPREKRRVWESQLRWAGHAQSLPLLKVPRRCPPSSGSVRAWNLPPRGCPGAVPARGTTHPSSVLPCTVIALTPCPCVMRTWFPAIPVTLFITNLPTSQQDITVILMPYQVFVSNPALYRQFQMNQRKFVQPAKYLSPGMFCALSTFKHSEVTFMDSQRPGERKQLQRYPIHHHDARQASPTPPQTQVNTLFSQIIRKRDSTVLLSNPFQC